MNAPANMEPIPRERLREYEALHALLMNEASPADREAPAIADWIARSSLIDGHLWQAMGLSERAQVRALMERHFPALAAANDRDMRWKRFFYKRLCGWQDFSN